MIIKRICEFKYEDVNTVNNDLIINMIQNEYAYHIVKSILIKGKKESKINI